MVPLHGTSSPLGATPCRDGVNFSVFSKHATGIELLLFDRRRRRAGRARDPHRSRRQSHLPLLARVRPWRDGRPDLRLSRRGAVGPRERHALRSHQGPSRPLRPWRGRSGSLQPRRRQRGRRQQRDRDEERRGRSVRLRLGRRRAAAAAIRADHHLRDACARLHPPSQLRRRREDPRHLRRPDREDPVSPAAGDHRGRAAAGVPVRCAGLPAGQGQLLGLCAGLVLRAASGIQLAPGPARPGGRVPRHGQGAAPGGHRGHPRRRVQPHRGR